LVQRLDALDEQLGGGLEVVFVVDGCPARSHEILAEQLPTASFASALVMHSRNFGSFAAIRTGLAHASGSYIGVMAADLQEPPELMIDFFAALERDEADVVVGVRRTRADAALSTISARLFWGVYRRLVQREMPPGGIDVFGCTRPFRDRLLTLEESNSSLVALTLWLGFRRATIEYDRQAREHGPSGWTLRKKLKYLSDSIFSFTDLPIRLLLGAGLLGVLGSVALATVVAIARLSGAIAVPGYAATIMVIAFFAALNLAGIGILGAYVWRTFENTKGRPGAVVMGEQRFAARRRQ
jgi:glycosyltransferase involved in cell wall biosynthesis